MKLPTGFLYYYLVYASSYLVYAGDYITRCLLTSFACSSFTCWVCRGQLPNLHRSLVDLPWLNIKGLFASHPGKHAWRRQRSQASDFGRLGLRCMPGDGVAWQGTTQTGPKAAKYKNFLVYPMSNFIIERRSREVGEGRGENGIHVKTVSISDVLLIW